ncbi:hypothetical protein RI367_005673 [Sorochytrium milnesiophthora]
MARKGRKCPVCNSRKFRKVDGAYVCEFGHQLQGYVEEMNEDAQEGVGMGRKMKSRKRMAAKRTRPASEVQYGEPALLLFYEGFQDILKMQLRGLERATGPIKELDNVVFDLWQLVLQEHQRSLTVRTAGKVSMRGINRRAGQSVRRHKLGLRLSSSLSILFLACLHLRVPIGIADILRFGPLCIARLPEVDKLRRLAATNAIPYLGAFQLVEAHNKNRLPSWYQNRLQAWVFPSFNALHHRTQRLARLLDLRYKLRFPPLNWPLYMNRYLLACRLPVAPTFVVLSRLAGFLSNSVFDLPPTGCAPEVRVMALLVIGLKLVYQLDDRAVYGHRHFRRSSKLTACSRFNGHVIFRQLWPSFDEWMKQLTDTAVNRETNPLLPAHHLVSLHATMEFAEQHPVEFAQHIDETPLYFKQKLPASLSDLQAIVDELYEHHGLSISQGSQLLPLFGNAASRLSSTQSASSGAPVPAEAGLEAVDPAAATPTLSYLRRVWQYPTYRASDGVLSLPDRLQRVLGVCANVAGCSKGQLHQAVCQMERGIIELHGTLRMREMDVEAYIEEQMQQRFEDV